MTASVTPFLMFEGQAETAMSLYTSLFENSEIVEIERYGPDGPGTEGSVVKACFTLNGRRHYCIDSPAPHEFSFTPAMSLFVDCCDERELDRLFAELSKDGQLLMPLDTYPFARKFAWVADRFGVSWQLLLA
jgi:predicted 3-demethylubiquinone-9 3-methyltransferase (glyoxalase superfamily)